MNNPETADITKIEDQKRLAESILIDIEEWCENEYSDGHRKHLGGSQIGKPCSRELYYAFRWVKKPDFGTETRHAGQVMRLFQRGHKEEISFTEYLVGIGCRLEATPETQLRITDVGGHFGGSLDNVGYLPERYQIPDRTLFEFKTMNMSNFNKIKRLVKKNRDANICEPILPKVKPEYWSQVCVYGYKMALKYVFFMIVDKNTDELYIEILAIDWEHGKTMLDKAAMIITAKQAPPQISLHRTNLSCKWCNFTDICHDPKNNPVEKNCRSCKHATAAEDKQWVCGLVAGKNNIIPDHVIPVGCPSHEGIQ